MPEKARQFIFEVLRHEAGDDAAGSAFNAAMRLAGRRAGLLERRAYGSDVEFGLSIVCWWPTGPSKPESYVTHAHLLREYILKDPAVVDSLIPDATLIMSRAALYELQETGRWEDVFSLTPTEGGESMY